MQSSRSKLILCQLLEHQLIFQSNSTATFKSLDTISGMILIDCNQNLQPNLSQMKFFVEKPALTGQVSILISRFLSNLPLKIMIHCATEQPFITVFWRPVLNFKFSVLMFLRSISSSRRIEQKCSNRKKIEIQSYSIITCIDKGLQSIILEYFVWPWYST